MTDQQKLLRVFRLIQLLSQPPYRTVKRLADLLEITPRTVYRYISLLEELGYQIDKKERDRYFLHVEFGQKDQMIDTEEAGFLQDLLWQAPSGHPIRDRLLHKLNRQFTLAPLAQSLSKFAVYEHIRSLSLAMESGLRVLLHNYYAPSSDTLSSRQVEPVEFMQGYTYLWAYDLDKGAYRQFKLDRIGEVEILTERIRTEHESHALDIFGWTGPQWLPVKLKLSRYAHNLLLEELPEARPFVRTFKGQAIFEGMVRDWRGIGRFILGLPGEVEVLDPQELVAYLRMRAAGGSWNLP